MIEPKLQAILEKADQSLRLSREECAYLLRQPAASPASGAIRATADAIIRRKTGNSAIVIGQIGADIHPCNADCKFCSFGESHTGMPRMRLDKDTLCQKAQEFAREDDLYGLYLMTMADCDCSYLLDAVSYVKSALTGHTQIWVNTGDCDASFYKELAAAGCTGAYHVCRLREGTDTKLDPKARVQSMEHILAAGLELYSCVEPIGPEHTVEELVDAIFLCLDLGVT